MSYLDYIHEHSHFIGEVHQQPFYIEQLYNVEDLKLIPNLPFQQCVDKLTGVPLTREFIKGLFRNNELYLGYVATMLWGGLGVGGRPKHLVMAMTMPKTEVEDKIYRISELINHGNLEMAFHSLQKTGTEDNKFQGVDISYFTKLLYFLYQGKDGLQPIIYDNWGCFIHAAILISQGEIETLNSYYKIRLNDKGKVYINLISNRHTGYRYAIYNDYLVRMSELSRELGLADSGILEEYLFGYDLTPRTARNDDNPRFFVKNFIQRFATDGSL